MITGLETSREMRNRTLPDLQKLNIDITSEEQAHWIKYKTWFYKKKKKKKKKKKRMVRGESALQGGFLRLFRGGAT